MAMTGEGQYLTSDDGTTVWAEATGNPTKPPVIFIHGLACTALVFEKQFSEPRMLENLYMIRYELRGHGRSGHPENAEAYASIRHAEDFKKVCEAFGVRKPFICGWSLGALAVADVVDAYGAEYISGVILPGGPVLTFDLHRQFLNPALASVIPLAMSTDGNELAKAASIFVDSCVLDPTKIPSATKITWMGGFLMQSPNVRKLVFTRSVDARRWEREIKTVPALLIQGREDAHSLAEKCIEISRKYMGNLEVKLLDGVGHAPCYECADKTNGFILDFVRRNTQVMTRL